MKKVDVVIVGAGFSGLYLLYRLRNEGFSVRLLEAQSGLGGVWQANRYPGARVDSHVPNYEYSMEECWSDWVWTEKFPGQEELVAYFEHVGHKLDLIKEIDFSTRVEACCYDVDGRWKVSVNNGDVYDAKFLVMCTGFGSKPYTPDIAGLETFLGSMHHTALWPKADVNLAGRKVGVIGTGASGVQVIQEVTPVAESLCVFQRTPVTALPMQQRRLDPLEQVLAKQKYPELFRRRNSPPGNFCDIFRLDLGAYDVSEAERLNVFEAAWKKGGFNFWIGTFNDILTNEASNRAAYDFWRDKTRARIVDPSVADILAPMDPPYPFGTKRPSLEQSFYECFNQQHVRLIDINQTPIEAILPTGLRTTAENFDLDVLILATGFDANTGGLTSIDIRGLEDRRLAEAWVDGVNTHLGVAVPSFPNMLMLYGPQSATAFCNGPTCAEFQGDWTSRLLKWMRAEGYHVFDVSNRMAEAWTKNLSVLANETLFGKTNSWYMGANIPGKRRQLLNYPDADAYRDQLRKCEVDAYSGFEFKRLTVSQ